MFLDFSSAIERYGKRKTLLMGITNPKQEEIIELGEKIIEAKVWEFISDV